MPKPDFGVVVVISLGISQRPSRKTLREVVTYHQAGHIMRRFVSRGGPFRPISIAKPLEGHRGAESHTKNCR